MPLDRYRRFSRLPNVVRLWNRVPVKVGSVEMLMGSVMPPCQIRLLASC